MVQNPKGKLTDAHQVAKYRIELDIGKCCKSLPVRSNSPTLYSAGGAIDVDRHIGTIGKFSLFDRVGLILGQAVVDGFIGLLGVRILRFLGLEFCNPDTKSYGNSDHVAKEWIHAVTEPGWENDQPAGTWFNPNSF